MIALRRLSEVPAVQEGSLTAVGPFMVANQIRNIIGQPPPGAPSAKAICPFVPNALLLDTIWIGSIEDTERDAVRERLDSFRPQFLSLEPTDDHVNRAAVILLPRCPRLSLEAIVDLRIELSLNGFLEAGLMLGAFKLPLRHSLSLPMFIVRHLVREDKNFLEKSNDPEERAIFVRVYEQLYGPLPS